MPNGVGNDKVTVLGVTSKQAVLIKNLINTTNSADTLDTKSPARQIIRGTRSVSPGGSSWEYNSYFKIIDASITSNGVTTNAVKIVDGATYNSSSGTSGNSVCKVNNSIKNIALWSSSAIVSNSIFAIKYTSTSNTVEIVALTTSLPSDTSSICYYQIGRAIIDEESKMTIQQDHITGIAQIFWFNTCS